MAPRKARSGGKTAVAAPDPARSAADPTANLAFEDRLAAFRRGDHLQSTQVPPTARAKALAERRSLAPWQPKTFLPSTVNLFEDVVGGREALIALLKLLDSDRTLQRLLPLLIRKPNWPLYRCLVTADVSPATLAKRVQVARTQFAQAAAARHIAETLPAVAANAMEQALPNYEALCPWCRGTGTRLEQRVTGQTLPSGVKEVQTVEVPCADCHGHGTSLEQPSIDRQRLALELGGLLQPKGAAVVVHNQNQQATISSNPGQALLALQHSLSTLDVPERILDAPPPETAVD